MHPASLPVRAPLLKPGAPLLSIPGLLATTPCTAVWALGEAVWLADRGPGDRERRRQRTYEGLAAGRAAMRVRCMHERWVHPPVSEMGTGGGVERADVGEGKRVGGGDKKLEPTGRAPGGRCGRRQYCRQCRVVEGDTAAGGRRRGRGGGGGKGRKAVADELRERRITWGDAREEVECGGMTMRHTDSLKKDDNATKVLSPSALCAAPR